MRAHLGHIQVNINAANLPFYAELMAFLGWPTVHDGDGILGVAGKAQHSIWFVSGETKAVANDHDGPGMNHLGFGTDTQAEVDDAAVFLEFKGIATLFETPRHRPEFASGEDQTYYQVMFATPDNLLIEVVYTGPKS